LRRSQTIGKPVRQEPRTLQNQAEVPFSGYVKKTIATN